MKQLANPNALIEKAFDLLDCFAALAMTNNPTGLPRYARNDKQPDWIAALRSQRQATPSLRGATRRGNPDALIEKAFDLLDCFATLAKTSNPAGLPLCARKDKQPRH